jgi:tRNA threonylcarbamoyladenosine biosynthesis protein TsaB
MNILALDTSTAIFSAAISSDKGVYYFEAAGGLRHAELLMDTTDYLMKCAGLAPGDLELAACMRGPGSFTGLRISFATLKGIALSLGIPMVSVPTLDCMALPHSAWPGLVLPLMDAKKGCFFTALYRGGRRLSEYLDAPPAEIAAKITAITDAPGPVLLTGPDACMLPEKLGGDLPPDRFYIDPGAKRGRVRELLDIVLKQGIIKGSNEVFSGPLYLRKSDAELTLKT